MATLLTFPFYKFSQYKHPWSKSGMHSSFKENPLKQIKKSIKWRNITQRRSLNSMQEIETGSDQYLVGYSLAYLLLYLSVRKSKVIASDIYGD